MLKFSNISILWKVLALVGVLSAVTIGGAFYATNRMRFIDNSYGDLLDGYGKANLAMARANRNLVYIDRSIYRLLAETNEDKKKEAAQEALDAVGFFQKQIKAATRALPDEADKIAGFGKRLDEIIAGDCADVLRLGVSVDAKDARTASQRMREVCDPALNKAMVDISAITNKLLKASEDAADDTLAVTNSTIRDTFFFNCGALAALATLAAFVARSGISKPIRAITETLEKLARGEMTTEIPGAARKDEVGMMARAAVLFRDQNQETLRVRQKAADAAEAEAERVARDREEKTRAAEQLSELVRLLGEALQGLAHGDLTTRLDGGFTGAYAQLRDDFNQAVERLAAAIGSVVGGANVISKGSKQILSASEDLARRAERQATTLEDSSASMRELAGVVSETADASTRTKDIISTAKHEATGSMAVVRETEQAIEQIKGSSERIGAIIGVIDEIAFQTSLLALNAGVEAARAGETGRGFAVVASEVRALAQRSADAAKEIKNLISHSADEVARGVDLVKATGAAFDRIKTQVSIIDGGIADIAGQTVDQSNTLKQVNLALAEIDQGTQQNAAMAEQATTACRSLTEQCVQLAEMVGRFRLPESAANRVAESQRGAQLASIELVSSAA
jgi:methyl-accepting chemotaxis protein